MMAHIFIRDAPSHVINVHRGASQSQAANLANRRVFMAARDR